jgi:dihydroorotase
MSGGLTIRQARLVLPDRVATGDLLIENGVIAEIGPRISRTVGEEVDGTGLVLLPGGIDAQVHFREPGLPSVDDIESGSRACAAGGVTSFLAMPTTSPPTTSAARLEEKLTIAKHKSAVHYGFFIGATNDNLPELVAADRTPAIHVRMGVSTDGLRIHERDALERIFASSNKPIALHAEDDERLRARTALFGATHDPADHPKRAPETSLLATKLAVELALKYGSRLHLLHVSSAEEAEFLQSVPRERITAETCPQYLTLAAPDGYARLRKMAQCTPPLRDQHHPEALWAHLLGGRFDNIASAHAPNTLAEKSVDCPRSPSGIPGVEWMMPLFLDQVHRGRLTLRQLVAWLCEGPARIYAIPRKGRLEVGYDGDVVLCDPNSSRVVGEYPIFTRAAWSPYEGMSITGWPVLTAVLGRPVFRDGQIIEDVRGEELTYDR